MRPRAPLVVAVVTDGGTNEVADPRRSVTPEAFAVAPALLGRPLASPWRRSAAMLVDLTAIVLLANTGGVALGLAFAPAFFRIATRSAAGRTRPSWVRGAFGCLGAAVLVPTVVVAWHAVRTATKPDAESGPRIVVGGAGEDGVELSGEDAIASLVDVAALRSDVSPERRELAARRMVERLTAGGLDEAGAAQMRAELDTLPLGDEGRAAIAAQLDAILGDERHGELSRLEIARAWVAATDRARAASTVADGSPPTRADTASSPESSSSPGTPSSRTANGSTGTTATVHDEAQRLELQLEEVMAAPRVKPLEARIARLEDRNRNLATELKAAREPPSLKASLLTLFDDLGVGFGWSAIYFTLFLALWRGRTPGKALLRCRVVRLDGRPLTYFAAFERFGGYAACVFTGLLGFLQVLWDDNRQGLHDKIATTVVLAD